MTTTGVTANITVRTQATLAESPALGSAEHDVNQLAVIALAAGTGSGNSDTLLTSSLDLASNATVTLDLNGTANKDEFGNNIAMADVQAIMVRNDVGSANPLVIGNAGSNPFLGPLAGDGNVTVSVKPGGVFLIADPAGWATNSSTAHELKIANVGAGQSTGEVVIIGRSA